MFQNSIFDVEAHFDKCLFVGDGCFDNCTFKGQDASFNFIKTQNTLSFKEIECQCFFAFRQSEVSGMFSFFRANFHKDASFDHTKFQQTSHFDQAKFHSKAHFPYVQFQQQASFLATSFQKVTFLNAQFHSEALFGLDYHTRISLEQEPSQVTQFEQLSDFTNCRFHKRAIFERVVFCQEARFAHCFFGEQANFTESLSKGQISFERMYCNQEFCAMKAVFHTVIFDYADINRRLDLTQAQIDNISLYKTTTDLIIVERYQIRRKLISQKQGQEQYDRAATEYLLLKESFHKRGLHEEEDWTYYKFKQSKRKDKTKRNFSALKTAPFTTKILHLLQLPLSFFERIFIDRATGYGTRPFNITIVAVSFVILFGAIYSYFPDSLVKPKDMPFGFSQAILFSVLPHSRQWDLEIFNHV